MTAKKQSSPTTIQKEIARDDEEVCCIVYSNRAVRSIRKIELVINHVVLDLAHHGNISSGNDDTSGS